MAGEPVPDCMYWEKDKNYPDLRSELLDLTAKSKKAYSDECDEIARRYRSDLVEELKTHATTTRELNYKWVVPPSLLDKKAAVSALTVILVNEDKLKVKEDDSEPNVVWYISWADEGPQPRAE